MTTLRLGCANKRLAWPWLVVALFAVSLTATSARASKEHPKSGGEALPNFHGFSIGARGPRSPLARVRISFHSGFSISLKPSSQTRYLGNFELDVNGRGMFGFLQIPPGRLGSKVTLRPIRDTAAQPQGSVAPLRVVLTTGSKPQFVISGFPAGSSRLDIISGGAGTSSSKLDGSCTKHLQSWRGSMLVTLADNSHHTGSATGSVACGYPLAPGVG